MEFLLHLTGFESQQVIAVGPGFLSRPKLLVNGKEAQRTRKRFEYVLRDNQGHKYFIEVRPIFLDPVPKVVIDGEEIFLEEKLTAIQWIWSGLPILLMFIGGAIGGFLGATAFWINTRIFRSADIGNFEKYLLTGAVTLILGLGWALMLFLIAAFAAGDFG